MGKFKIPEKARDIRRPVRRLWYEFLFSREFLLSTSLLPDEVVEHITILDERYPESSNVMNCEVRSREIGTDVFLFEIKTRWKGSSLRYTTARVRGEIWSTGGRGSYVRGHAMFGATYYIGILVYTLLIVLVATRTNNVQDIYFWLWVLGAGAILTVFWRYMFNSRNQLVELIYLKLNGDDV